LTRSITARTDAEPTRVRIRVRETRGTGSSAIRPQSPRDHTPELAAQGRSHRSKPIRSAGSTQPPRRPVVVRPDEEPRRARGTQARAMIGRCRPTPSRGPSRVHGSIVTAASDHQFSRTGDPVVEPRLAATHRLQALTPIRTSPRLRRGL